MTKIENTITGETENFATITDAFEAIDRKDIGNWLAIDGITGGEIRRYNSAHDSSEWAYTLVESPGVEHNLRGEK